MKKIEAVIKPFKFEEVKSALSQVGVQGMTVTEVRGFGRQKGHSLNYRGSEYRIDLVPKLKLEITVGEQMAPAVMETICRVARTGEIGDGKVWVEKIGSVIRIRTGETGESAI